MELKRKGKELGPRQSEKGRAVRKLEGRRQAEEMGGLQAGREGRQAGRQAKEGRQIG